MQGTYRINYPITKDSYELGFVIGDDANITYDNCKIHSEYKARNGSQYFVVLDKDNNLESDKTYYYRFYLHTGGKYYYADADTFHLGRTVTVMPTGPYIRLRQRSTAPSKVSCPKRAIPPIRPASS